MVNMHKPLSGTASEMTGRAIILSLVLAVVMGASNVYLGLKLGMTVSASIPAAVVAMMIFRLLKKSSSPVLESNLVQTAASAGESMAAGVLFTTPALLMMGVRDNFDYFEITTLSVCSGLLGVLFMVPMRRVFVASPSQDLKFPEAMACAAVLKAGQNQDKSSGGGGEIMGGVGFGALFKLLSSFLGILNNSIGKVFSLGPKSFLLSFDTSLAVVAVGYIVGWNVSVLMAASGAATWLAMPFFIAESMNAENATDLLFGYWASTARYLGVGVMIVGGVECIYRVRNNLVDAVRSVFSGPLDGQSEDLSKASIFGIFLVAAISLLVFFKIVVGSFGLSLAMILLTIILSAFFTAAMCYIAGLIGMSNCPLSGIMISCILIAGAVLTVLGFGGELAMTACLLVVTASGCSLVIAGDACNDLKTGSMLGSSPWKQQLAQIVGVIASSLIMAPVLNLLHNNTPGGIGGQELAAPQASLIASLISGIFGQAEISLGVVGMGAILAVCLLIADRLLQRTEVSFRLMLMPVGLGIYLPLEISLPLLIGASVSLALTYGKEEKKHEGLKHRGTMFASGLIAGESLVGLLIAGLSALSVSRMDLIVDPTLSLLVSVALYGGFLWLFRKVSQNPGK